MPSEKLIRRLIRALERFEVALYRKLRKVKFLAAIFSKTERGITKNFARNGISIAKYLLGDVLKVESYLEVEKSLYPRNWGPSNRDSHSGGQKCLRGYAFAAIRRFRPLFDQRPKWSATFWEGSSDLIQLKIAFVYCVVFSVFLIG